MTVVIYDNLYLEGKKEREREKEIREVGEK